MSPKRVEHISLMDQLDSQRRKVDFDTYDISVQQLISMVDDGQINVSPAYQRKFRWDNLKKSRLIESIFLGVPVPSLFMATNKDATWEVVDGMQRLSTLAQFCGNPETLHKLSLGTSLVISDLEKLNSLNKHRFIDLPRSIQSQFMTRPIKVITLSDKSDHIVRFDLFERLNTGGVTLTDQEIRSCVFRGPYNDFIERLSINRNFMKVVKLTKRQENDGTRPECVLRFFAYYHNYNSFVHSVVDFLNEFMQNKSLSFDHVREEDLFITTFGKLAEIFPNGILRSKSRNKTPMNLYEAVAVGAALAINETGTLATDGADSWVVSDELKKLTTGATNSRKMVKGRIEFCRDRFLGK